MGFRVESQEFRLAPLPVARADGDPLIPGTSITADFSDNGKITGTAGCNQYFASYALSGSSLSIGSAGSTKMYCSSPEGTMEQETAYLLLLEQAATWSLDGDTLELRDTTGTVILVYTLFTGREDTFSLEYARTGGIPGFDDHLVLSADGSGTVVRKETTYAVQVPEPTMHDLITHLIAADFPSLDPWYPAPDEGADYFTYSLTYNGITVVTEDTGIPPVLMPIISMLNEILGSKASEDEIQVLF